MLVARLRLQTLAVLGVAPVLEVLVQEVEAPPAAVAAVELVFHDRELE